MKIPIAILMMIATGFAGLNMTVNQANVTQVMTASGYLVNDSTNSSIPGIIIVTYFDNFGLNFSTTDSNGFYSNSITVPMVATGNYSINSTATSGEQNLTNIQIYGRTAGVLNVSPNIIYTSGANFSVSTSFNGTVQNFSVNFSAFNITYNSTHLQANFSVPTDNFSSGTYTIPVSSSWINDDGTRGVSDSSFSVVLQNNYSLSYTCTSFNLNLAINSTQNASCILKSSSNTPLTIDVSTIGAASQWINLSNTSFVLEPGQSINFSIPISIPYSTRADKYPGKIFFSSAAGFQSFAMVLNLTEPSFAITGLGPIYNIEAIPTLNVTLTLKNTGSLPAYNLRTNVTCPSGWECSISPNEFPIMNASESRTIQLLVEISNPQSIANKQITLTAYDGIRTNTVSTFITVVAMSTILTSDQFIVEELMNPILNTYYLLGADGNLFISPTLNVTTAVARTQRNSSLTSWIVKLGNRSAGIGTICDVSLVVGSNKYDINPATAYTTGQVLEGEVGSLVYEAYRVHQLGICKIDLIYSGEAETETWLVVLPNLPPGTMEFTQKQLNDTLNGCVASCDEKVSNMWAWIIGIIIMAFVVMMIVYFIRRKEGYVNEDQVPQTTPKELLGGEIDGRGTGKEGDTYI